MQASPSEPTADSCTHRSIARADAVTRPVLIASPRPLYGAAPGGEQVIALASWLECP
jgi:hypothetical protein